MKEQAVIKSTELMLGWALQRLNQLNECEKDRHSLFEEYRELIQNFYCYNSVDKILYIEFLREFD